MVGGCWILKADRDFDDKRAGKVLKHVETAQKRKKRLRCLSDYYLESVASLPYLHSEDARGAGPLWYRGDILTRQGTKSAKRFFGAFLEIAANLQ